MGVSIDPAAMFLLGLFGSGHCLGMCGPLVVALPGVCGTFRAHAAYHAGRLATYTLVGGLLGLLGSLPEGSTAAWETRLQVALSLPVALFMLLLGLHRLGIVVEPVWMATAAPHRWPGYGRVMRRALTQRDPGSLMVMGAMLGLLPCGLSYGAFARALTAGSAGTGALWALLFGLGTLPALLLLGGSAAAVWRRFRTQAELLAGLILIAMALGLMADAWTVFSR